MGGEATPPRGVGPLACPPAHRGACEPVHCHMPTGNHCGPSWGGVSWASVALKQCGAAGQGPRACRAGCARPGESGWAQGRSGRARWAGAAQAPPAQTRLLKEEKGSRRSSYWVEYRSSVSSLLTPCTREERPIRGTALRLAGAHRRPWGSLRAGRGCWGDSVNVTAGSGLGSELCLLPRHQAHSGYLRESRPRWDRTGYEVGFALLLGVFLLLRLASNSWDQAILPPQSP